MPHKQLPIGIQTFREIREGDYCYVDKTGFALRLIEEGKYYFLSRPRRFGKSLFLDLLAELFSGNQALFKGLEVDHQWDWSHAYPACWRLLRLAPLLVREPMARLPYQALLLR